MSQLHLAFGVAAAVIGVALLVTALAGVVANRPMRRELDRLILAELVVVGLAIAIGALVLVTGHSPTDPLHLLYAVAAFAILPLARFGMPSLQASRRRWVVIVGVVVLLGLMVRLWQTGGAR